MDQDFFANFAKWEVLAFFSGFPLLYALAVLLAGNEKTQRLFGRDIRLLLPLSYALVGTLYLGLLLRNMYADFTHQVSPFSEFGFLKVWAILSLLFWIPFFRRSGTPSLLHSLVFFFLLAKDLLLNLAGHSVQSDTISNEMKLYTNSLLLNLAALASVLIFYFFFRRNRPSTG